MFYTALLLHFLTSEGLACPPVGTPLLRDGGELANFLSPGTLRLPNDGQLVNPGNLPAGILSLYFVLVVIGNGSRTRQASPQRLNLLHVAGAI